MLLELPSTISMEALAKFARENGCTVTYPTVGFFRLEPRPINPPVSAVFPSRSATLPSRPTVGSFIPS